jgi:hypothetical protein
VAISALAAAAQFQLASQLVAQSSGPHRHRGQLASMSDVDTQGSSVASAPSSSSKVGSKLDVTA